MAPNDGPAPAEADKAPEVQQEGSPMWRRFEGFFRRHSFNALDPAQREAGSPSAAAAAAAAADGSLSGGQHAHHHEHPHASHAHDHHEPRISHRAEVLVEARLDDLAHDHLVPHVEHKPGVKRRALLVNSWVLLVAAGILAITIVSVDRLHIAEPLQDAHAVTSAEPYLVPINSGPIDFLYIVVVGAPWYGAGVLAGGKGGGVHVRRLLAERPPAAGAGDPLAAAAAPMSAAAAAALGLPALRSLPSRRVLAAAAAPAAADEAPAPKLLVSLMQRNATAPPPAAAVPLASLAESIVTPQQLGLVPIAPVRSCQMKAGAAARCLLDFEGRDIEQAAYSPGADTYLVFSMEQPGQVAFTVHANELGGFGRAKNWVALAILLLMLVGIASERVHRMYCAFLGAFAMMSLLLWMNMTPSLETVTSWLDESTLGLLFGMMILVGQLKNTGLFEVLCAATLRACRGRLWLLSIMLLYLTGVVSAFLDNVTTMLLLGPITISLMHTCGRDPRPLLMAQVLFSNIGGTATMVGDPPNIIIGTALSKHLGFVDFIVNLAPGVIIASLPALALLLLFYRSTLLGAFPNYEACVKATSDYRILDWDLMAKAGYITVVVVIGFLLHPVHHLDPAWYAIMGAVLLVVSVAPMEVEEVLHAVEWDMLLFFAAQFVMVEAAAEIGMIDMLAGWLEAAIRAAPPASRTIVAIEIMLWASAVISGILDNIPYTITMVPVIEYLAAAGLGLELRTLAWALAFGACFGGNATLIGASANIVTITLLDKSGHKVSFLEWMKVGVPLTIVTVGAANLYMLRYAF
ncbi:hypothetical protein Rsub_01198 [Raphidocelis subcapitata]|uniref:Citrate transporter-like domain-containing protein n=1 Tax=Raphidocelis subcapitata TaxID=307507 RepID=A0A2V0NUI9_9CHLO|nr:hypothetical protein Rsub_01198 [Raphidocelis subcapitata]|eukprot:GBF88485.1 hypothetical protein Rsub_01198 [Raphidocelis subcapitata]